MGDEDDFSGFHGAAKKIEAERKAAAAEQESEPVGKKGKISFPTKEDNTKNLRARIDRIIRMEEEKKSLSEDIKVEYQGGKNDGYAPKAIKNIVREEMEDGEKKAAREAIEFETDAMRLALGDFASSPLGDAAMSRTRR